MKAFPLFGFHYISNSLLWNQDVFYFMIKDINVHLFCAIILALFNGIKVVVGIPLNTGRKEFMNFILMLRIIYDTHPT